MGSWLWWLRREILEQICLSLLENLEIRLEKTLRREMETSSSLLCQPVEKRSSLPPRLPIDWLDKDKEWAVEVDTVFKAMFEEKGWIFESNTTLNNFCELTDIQTTLDATSRTISSPTNFWWWRRNKTSSQYTLLFIQILPNCFLFPCFSLSLLFALQINKIYSKSVFRFTEKREFVNE